MTQLDPITFEVIRHRLWTINDDQARAAASLSGSPVVFEGYDFNAALTTAGGDGLFVGVYVMHHATGIDFFVRRLLEQWALEDIREGDMFFTNDPWWGALHPHDAILAMPIFAEGKLVMWSGIVMHENDVGSPVPGSFVVGARDRFGEGPLLPGVRMVENFKLRADIEAIWLRNTRTPHLNELNLRARLSALQRTSIRIGELIARYGLDTFVAAQHELISYVERVTRQRIASLPDGTWSSHCFHDHDGTQDKVYDIKIRVSKQGDRLVLDTTGSSRQAQGPINCTRATTEGVMLGVLLMTLCHDLPWSIGGLRRAVEIVTEPGTIVDAIDPSPMSMASIMASLTLQDAMLHATGQMLLSAEDSRDEACGSWTPSMQGCSVITPPTGPGQEPAFAILANSFGGGGGARPFADGIDSGGMYHSMSSRIPSIETLEQRGFVLHHFRRELPNSGGPGRWRGGVGLEYGVTQHKAKGPSFVSTISSGVTVPAGRGLAGGMPGGPAGTTMYRGTNVQSLLASGRIPGSIADFTFAEADVQAPKARSGLGRDDVMIGIIQGGAGYGDPLERDPGLVQADVREGLVSMDVAATIYGVVFSDDGSVAAALTDEHRAALRRARLEGAAGSQVMPTKVDGTRLHPVADRVEAVQADGERRLRCTECTTDLGGYGQSYAELAVSRDLQLGANGARTTGYRDGFVLRELSCPGCGVALSHDVQRAEDPRASDSHLAA